MQFNPEHVLPILKRKDMRHYVEFRLEDKHSGKRLAYIRIHHLPHWEDWTISHVQALVTGHGYGQMVYHAAIQHASENSSRGLLTISSDSSDLAKRAHARLRKSGIRFTEVSKEYKALWIRPKRQGKSFWMSSEVQATSSHA